jgi:hypothetical protein
MKRTTGALVLLAALGSCVTVGAGRAKAGLYGCGGMPNGSGAAVPSCYGGCGTPVMVPGLQGPWGQPVPMASPYSAAPPDGAAAARAMLSRSIPLDIVQASGLGQPAPGSGVVQADFSGAGCPAGGCGSGSGLISPPGFPAAPGAPPPGAVAAVGAMTGQTPSRFPTRRTEVRFVRPTGMKVSWFTSAPDGRHIFTSTQLEAPGRYNFGQGAIYRLKLTNIEGRPGLVVYPTLEVIPSTPKTDPFLAHSSVPVEFTNEDFDQVAAGNYVVKVIYLPDPAFQDVAIVAGPGGLGEIVSSRLEPGVDPILEAQRRGTILLVIRMGNILLELDNTPPMDAPNPYACPQGMAQGTGGPMGAYGPAGLGGQMPVATGMPPSTVMGPGGPVFGNPMTLPSPVQAPPSGKPTTLPTGTGSAPPAAISGVPLTKAAGAAGTKLATPSEPSPLLLPPGGDDKGAKK